jgi:hypothetical protein
MKGQSARGCCFQSDLQSALSLISAPNAEAQTWFTAASAASAAFNAFILPCSYSPAFVYFQQLRRCHLR